MKISEFAKLKVGDSFWYWAPYYFPKFECQQCTIVCCNQEKVSVLSDGKIEDLQIAWCLDDFWHTQENALIKFQLMNSLKALIDAVEDIDFADFPIGRVLREEIDVFVLKLKGEDND